MEQEYFLNTAALVSKARAKAGNSKHETRNNPACRQAGSKSEGPNDQNAADQPFRSFGFGAWGLFRISDFEIRISGSAVTLSCRHQQTETNRPAVWRDTIHSPSHYGGSAGRQKGLPQAPAAATIETDARGRWGLSVRSKRPGRAGPIAVCDGWSDWLPLRCGRGKADGRAKNIGSDPMFFGWCRCTRISMRAT